MSDEDFTPDYAIEDGTATDATNVLDGTSDNGATGTVGNDLATDSDLVTSSISFGTSLTASANTSWQVTNLDDYGADEEEIAGSFRWCVGRSIEGDSIYIKASHLATFGNNVIKLKRALSSMYTRNVYVEQDVDGACFKLIFEPDETFENPRFTATLASSSTASASFTDIVWQRWIFDSSSIYQAPLFSMYNGTLDFTRCGFIGNVASGSAKGVIICPSTSTDGNEFSFTSCYFFGNVVNNTAGTSDPLAIVNNLGKKSSAVKTSFDSCTAAFNWNGDGTVADVAFNRRAVTVTYSILESYTADDRQYTADVARIIPNFETGDFRVDGNQPEASVGRTVKLDYEGYPFTSPGPIGCLATVIKADEDFLTYVFGNDESLIADALTSLEVPLSHTDASQYFGVKAFD